MDTHNDTDIEGSSRFDSLGFVKIYLKKIFTKNVDEDLKSLIEGRDDAEVPLSHDEKELIEAVLRFSSIDADDACVPRSDIVHLSKNDDFDTVVSVFKESGYSRLPVCGKDLDEMVGFVTLKDVFQEMSSTDSAFDLKEVMRPCTFVPESIAIPSVLDAMRANAVQMAIVVDEYGGTTGLITVKDIMEELVGDLEDENEQDQDAAEDIVELADGRFEFDARVELEGLDDSIRLSLAVPESSECETVGGFVLDLAGRVPEEGAIFELASGGKLVVVKADGRRIHKVSFIPPIS